MSSVSILTIPELTGMLNCWLHTIGRVFTISFGLA